jgi:hypothetical protein
LYQKQQHHHYYYASMNICLMRSQKKTHKNGHKYRKWIINIKRNELAALHEMWFNNSRINSTINDSMISKPATMCAETLSNSDINVITHWYYLCKVNINIIPLKFTNLKEAYFVNCSILIWVNKRYKQSFVYSHLSIWLDVYFVNFSS